MPASSFLIHRQTRFAPTSDHDLRLAFITGLGTGCCCRCTWPTTAYLPIPSPRNAAPLLLQDLELELVRVGSAGAVHRVAERLVLDQHLRAGLVD